MKQMLLIVLVLLLVWGEGKNAWARGRNPTAPAPFSSKDIETLQADPASLLSRFPKGGPPMADYVARAVMADVAVADTLLSVAGKASSDQSSAMGAGFARAARMMGGKKPEAARALAEKVMRSENIRMRVTFQAIGPHYKALAPYGMPNLVPMKKLADVDVGTESTTNALGRPAETPLPLYLNSARLRDAAGRKDGEVREETLLEKAFTFTGVIIADVYRGDRISAIIASDAQRNGAISTSPVH